MHILYNGTRNPNVFPLENINGIPSHRRSNMVDLRPKALCPFLIYNWPLPGTLPRQRVNPGMFSTLQRTLVRPIPLFFILVAVQSWVLIYAGPEPADALCGRKPPNQMVTFVRKPMGHSCHGALTAALHMLRPSRMTPVVNQMRRVDTP
jgi:hypothetical protein